jgi:hypothetical protein
MQHPMSHEKFLAFLQSTYTLNTARVLSRKHKAHIPNAQISHTDILVPNILVCSNSNTKLTNSAIFGLLSDLKIQSSMNFTTGCKIYSPCNWLDITAFHDHCSTQPLLCSKSKKLNMGIAFCSKFSSIFTL